MYKLIIFTLLSVFVMMLHALQVDEELALNSLFHAKHALNRSTHAAAQQLNQDKLAWGIVSIDEDIAQMTALHYLQQNLNLDVSNMPLPNAFLRTKVELLLFEVINEEHSFPFKYTNNHYDYSVTLQKPGVIMIIKVLYPRTFNILGPVTWQIKGVAETVEQSI